MMTTRFEYGISSIKDLQVVAFDTPPTGKKRHNDLVLNGEKVRTSDRFWNSLHMRFGFTSNIFRYFTHSEVFDRIGETSPNDRIRWCLERGGDGGGRMLGVTSPSAAVMRHDDLLKLLNRYEAQSIKYANGVVSSQHSLRMSGTFKVGGDGFQNKFILATPIDGFGKPSVYLSLLRLVCSNGAVAMSRAFRSELSIGRGDDGVAFTLTRVLDGFNNEDGYVALRQRFESSTRSWASVNEVNRLHKVLARVHQRVTPTPLGGDGASECGRSPLFRSFHKMSGDLTTIYGMANLDALSSKRQRTLPAACKVYDLLNFASEVATHHADEIGARSCQAYIGDLISGEYDLEGTCDQFSDWRDFFIGSDATATTMSDLAKRS
jgi:hypothetical protein